MVSDIFDRCPCQPFWRATQVVDVAKLLLCTDRLLVLAAAQKDTVAQKVEAGQQAQQDVKDSSAEKLASAKPANLEGKLQWTGISKVAPPPFQAGAGSCAIILHKCSYHLYAKQVE